MNIETGKRWADKLELKSEESQQDSELALKLEESQQESELSLKSEESQQLDEAGTHISRCCVMCSQPLQ